LKKFVYLLKNYKYKNSSFSYSNIKFGCLYVSQHDWAKYNMTYSRDKKPLLKNTLPISTDAVIKKIHESYRRDHEEQRNLKLCIKKYIQNHPSLLLFYTIAS